MIAPDAILMRAAILAALAVLVAAVVSRLRARKRGGGAMNKTDPLYKLAAVFAALAVLVAAFSAIFINGGEIGLPGEKETAALARTDDESDGPRGDERDAEDEQDAPGREEDGDGESPTRPTPEEDEDEEVPSFSEEEKPSLEQIIDSFPEADAFLQASKDMKTGEEVRTLGLEHDAEEFAKEAEAGGYPLYVLSKSVPFSGEAWSAYKTLCETTPSYRSFFVKYPLEGLSAEDCIEAFFAAEGYFRESGKYGALDIKTTTYDDNWEDVAEFDEGVLKAFIEGSEDYRVQAFSVMEPDLIFRIMMLRNEGEHYIVLSSEFNIVDEPMPEGYLDADALTAELLESLPAAFDALLELAQSESAAASTRYGLESDDPEAEFPFFSALRDFGNVEWLLSTHDFTGFNIDPSLQFSVSNHGIALPIYKSGALQQAYDDAKAFLTRLYGEATSVTIYLSESRIQNPTARDISQVLSFGGNGYYVRVNAVWAAPGGDSHRSIEMDVQANEYGASISIDIHRY